MTRAIPTLVFFLFAFKFLIAQNCSRDTTPPLAYCKANLSFEAGFTITTDLVDAGSFDNCTPEDELIFTFCEGHCTPKTTEVFYLPGTYTFTLFVRDKSGNTSSCEQEITIVSNCEEDSLPPFISNMTSSNLTARTNRTVSAKELVNEDFIQENCTPKSELRYSFSPNPNDEERSYQKAGVYPIEIYVTDAKGNQSSFNTKLTVKQDCNGGVYELICKNNVRKFANKLLTPGMFIATTNCRETMTNLFFSSHDNQRSITISELGVHPIEITSILPNGERLVRTSNVEILLENRCEDDVEAPIFDCQSVPYLNINEPLYILELILEAGDNCSDRSDLRFSFSPNDPSDNYTLYQEAGTYDITIYAYDENGNISTCQTQITVVASIDCEEDQLPPKPIYDEDFVRELGELLFIDNVVFGGYDNCSDASDIISSFAEDRYVPAIQLDATGAFPYEVWTMDRKGNTAYRASQVYVYDCNDLEVSISVEMLEEGLGRLRASTNFEQDRQMEYYWNDQSGTNDQNFFFREAGTYTVTAISQLGCKSSISVLIEEDFSHQIEQLEECAIMQIDLSATRLRRCFDDNIYYINYANYGAETAENAYAEIQLSPLISYVSSSLPAEELGDNLYRFDLGNVEGGRSGNFQIQVEVSCEASLGQTHCSTANIYPNQPCNPSGNWSGAEVSLEAKCTEEEVAFSITNTGTGDMNESRSYITIEDVVMWSMGDFKLKIGESQEFRLPKNGSTYRLQAEQVENYPLKSQPSIALEGCGTNESGTFSMGFINQFPLDEDDPSIAIDCQENVGSFDSNDKSATPLGIGVNHILAQNTDIEYKIRFQNTGTDTAFTVVILDTLSPLLDTASIQLGVSSHPYSYELLNSRIMKFTFPNIMLPDSSINILASEGFVQFRIAQHPNLSNGSLVQNSATIYFDFNDSITTNTFQHVIGDALGEVISETQQFAIERHPVTVAPNPYTNHTTISLAGQPQHNLQIEVYDQLGRLRLVKPMKNNQVTLNEDFLNKGYYFF
ncbi:MAG: T9SS type A sorting domain-containing protein, partial [Bacteroidota bacterium]